ncbi:hypothetical protein [Paracoccus sp. (in: a-proteobacteria)]|uniref:hypothetical protein n=1 Tax=Paracoccus sp. TaxID=267 RepID=UPI00321FA4FA
MAKLTKPIIGCANGEIYPREYAEGEECPAELEAYAESIGALAETKAAKKAPETK